MWSGIINHLEPGDAILVAGRGLIGGGIAWWTGGPFSHVAIYWGSFSGFPLIIEAHAEGIYIDSLDKYRPEDCAVFRLRAPKSYRKHIPIAALSYLNYQYSFKQIAGFIISKLTGTKINPWQEDGALVCSELYAKATLGALGKSGLISPNTIAQSKAMKQVVIAGLYNDRKGEFNA